jgi:glucan endo-1,3-alpha-glucosidase
MRATLVTVAISYCLVGYVRLSAGLVAIQNIALRYLIEGIAIDATVSANVRERLVFAHNMLAFATYGATTAGYEHDIRNAQAAGIDGFALNAGGWIANRQSYYKTNATHMFAAANALGTGFKLFFSIDECCGNQASDAIDMITTFGNDPAYFKYHGKAVLSTFGAEHLGDPTFWWTNVLTPLTNAGHPVFFVPSVCTRPCTETPTSAEITSMESTWNGISDGYLYWGIAGIPDYTSSPPLLPSTDAFASITAANNKIYIAPIAAQFWAAISPSAGRRYYEYSGGAGIQAMWNDVINTQKPQPQWVEIITWNDFSESYETPATSDAVYPWSTTPRIAFTPINAYYAQWYKTGVQPTISNDQLYYFYRTHPKAATASADSYGPVTRFYGPVADDLYVTTFLTAAATLTVSSGGKISSYSLNAGIANTSIPFTVGTQIFTLTRNGTTITSVRGEDIIADPTFYNFFYATGLAYGNHLMLAP